MYPGSIRNLIECLKDLPGIGEKSAERLAYAIVGFDKDKLDTVLYTLSETIRICTVLLQAYLIDTPMSATGFDWYIPQSMLQPFPSQNT